MKCCVDGCDSDAVYKTKELCQKHYFRQRRGGTVNLRRKRKYRYTTSNGYQMVSEPCHQLSNARGYVYEHRKVLFDSNQNIDKCEICGAEWSWDAIYFSHVDHKNNDKSDNRTENLRPLCNSCNVKRSYYDRHSRNGSGSVTINGITKTPEEWSREDGVNVTGHTIRRRIASGMSDYEAVFAEKKTHNGKKYTQKRKTEHKHQRKNSISITINGETKTAAEWSRDERCHVSDSSIRARIKAGVNPSDAVLMKRCTLTDLRGS